MSAGRALALVSLAAVLANSTWFSATAVVPSLDREWHLGASGAAWLIAAVQLGFIAGSVGAALVNLPDRLAPRRLIAGAAVAAAAANAALLLAGGLGGALPSPWVGASRWCRWPSGRWPVRRRCCTLRAAPAARRLAGGHR